jgi:hypothetical protein
MITIVAPEGRFRTNEKNIPEITENKAAAAEIISAYLNPLAI